MGAAGAFCAICAWCELCTPKTYTAVPNTAASAAAITILLEAVEVEFIISTCSFTAEICVLCTSCNKHGLSARMDFGLSQSPTEAAPERYIRLISNRFFLQ
jgi:hypothetical protein